MEPEKMRFREEEDSFMVGHNFKDFGYNRREIGYLGS